MIKKDLISELKTHIQNKVLVRANSTRSIAQKHDGGYSPWLMDFRTILFDPLFLHTSASLFWDMYGDLYPFQVGGMETVSIALTAAIVLEGERRGTPVNGFYIRKSRKHYGLQKIIEGELSEAPVVLVDDLINSGSTFLKQAQILKTEGKKILGVFALLRYRDIDEYSALHEQNLRVVAPISVTEFGLDIKIPQKTLPAHNSFVAVWKYATSKPNYFYRVPKSAPVIDDKFVYFGTDDGIMRALKQETGGEVWSFKMFGFGDRGKTIFSSPALYGDTLYFGAYDGNFYALDAQTGKKKWIYMDADWIGSSPCVAEDLGLVFVGLEYGLLRKRGGIVALDAKSGKKKWEHIDMPEFTHGSPAYSQKYGVVAIGSNDGCLYLFRAKDGTLLWKLQTGGEIKTAPAFDDARGLVIFGSMDGAIYIVDVKNGKVEWLQQTGAGIYSTPLVSGNYAYVSSLDKYIYCINLHTHSLEWQFLTGGRVFASPALINGHIYVGANDGKLYELDAKTGKNIAFLQTTERITNKIAYNKETGRFFVLTYANELYCVEKNK